MDKHFELIFELCEVHAISHNPEGIYYTDGGFGYAEVYTEEGLASYSCNSIEEFKMIVGV